MKTKISPDQADLFAPPSLDRPTQPRAGKHHRDAKPTELKAALDMATKIGKQTVEVLRIIANSGYKGVTRWDLTTKHGILRSSACGRVAELERELAYIEDTGRTRIGPTGKPEGVYVATERGRRYLREQSRRRAS